MCVKLFKINIFLLLFFFLLLIQSSYGNILEPVKSLFNKEILSEPSIINYEEDFEKRVLKYKKKLSNLDINGNGNERAKQQVYKKILQNYPKASIAKDAAYERGLYLIKKQKWIEAFQALSLIKIYHPDYDKLTNVIELQFKCAENVMNSKKKRDFLGFSNSYKYNIESAPLFLNYAKLYPYDKNTPLALLNSAKVSKNNKSYETAIYSLKSLINDYPDSPFTDQAYFLIAHIYSEFIKGPNYDLESTREAIRYCEDFIALYPDHENLITMEVLYERMLNNMATNRVHLADYYYFNKSDNVAAIIFYNEAITVAPNSQAAIEAKERLHAIEIGIRPTTGQSILKKILLIN